MAIDIPSDAAKEENKVPGDAVGLTPKQGDSPDDAETKTLALWKKRFDRADNYRKAHIDRMMRMYKLYRAYRDATNYAYGTNIMPPIGFEIVETIKPRLASADIDITVQPTTKDGVDSPFLADWDTLIDYDLSVLGGQTSFDDIKIQWINSMLIYGNGILQVSWKGGRTGDPFAEVIDPFLLYVDPQATNRMLDSRWEIKWSSKSKAIIVAEEEKRDVVTEERGKDGTVTKSVDASGRLYNKNILDVLEDKPIKLDPRVDRTNLVALRMGQINDGIKRGQATDAGAGTSTTDKNSQETAIELWECFDHVTGKLTVIANRERVIRDEESPYLKIRKGRVFIDLPDISLNWEFYAMSHLEPVETTIYEIADSRNQAMDAIVFSLDPIKKVKKGKGYKPEDLKSAPGAMWEMDNTNDVVTETGPEISNEWVAKDNLLRTSIQTALALSEYTQGNPSSAQEPGTKVELLLAQTNMRFSLLVRQMEIAFKDLINAIIEMNQEFLDDAKEYRLTGTKTTFKSFGPEAKQIGVDATVSIDPKPEKSAQQVAAETAKLYDVLVTNDKPIEGDPVDAKLFQQRKRTMQKLMIKAYGYDQYMALLMGPDAEAAAAAEPAKNVPPTIPIANAPAPAEPATPAPQPVEIIPPEGGAAPKPASPQGPIARLLARMGQ